MGSKTLRLGAFGDNISWTRFRCMPVPATWARVGGSDTLDSSLVSASYPECRWHL